MNMPFGTLDRTPPPFFKQGPSALTRVLFYSAMSVLLMVADARWHVTSPLRSAIAVLIYPVQQVTMAPVRWAVATKEYFSGMQAAQDLRAQAQIQLALQSQRVLQLNQLEQENLRLRELLGLQPRLTVHAQAAEVMYEAADPFTEKIVIDRGSARGVRLGSPVIDSHGVLGQVTRVYPLSAEATLLTDKDAAIPVINTRTKERVVAFGRPAENAMELRFMAGNADVQVGDELRTSGLDGIYLAGLPVARVTRVDRRADSAFARIMLQPAARLQGVSHVLVVDPVAAHLPALAPGAGGPDVTAVKSWSAASALASPAASAPAAAAASAAAAGSRRDTAAHRRKQP